MFSPAIFKAISCKSHVMSTQDHTKQANKEHQHRTAGAKKRGAPYRNQIDGNPDQCYTAEKIDRGQCGDTAECRIEGITQRTAAFPHQQQIGYH